MTDEEIKAAQYAQTQHYLKSAEYSELRTALEAQAAGIAVEKARVELKTAELLHHRVKLSNRPSMALAIRLEPEDREGRTVYVVSYMGLLAEGDTPEIACQNFDRLWAGVEHD